ncbi:MAG: hypothetical protein N3A69_13425, partial [Leptospiraceae bacterium]|nr:hypothetical protein [Leptospiraceae bacterium]
YYGTEIWKTEDLNLLKSYAECIIYDACLSIPAITATQMSADLVLFSTGKSKIVDLGYGAIAFCKPSYKLEVHETVMKTFTNSYYEQLERKWKDALANKKIFLIDNLVFSEWIDCNNNLITSNYERELEVKRREILIHKERINRIYKEIIPKELIAHNLSDIWRFNLFVKNKKILLNSIFEKGLFASSHYANCERVLYGKSDLEGSNFVEKNIVNLFNDFNFNESMAENCGFIIKDLFEKKLIQTVV